METTYVCDCGHPESEHSDITRGYGTDKDGMTWCYSCCAAKDRVDMLKAGRAMMYIAGDGKTVGTWPGALAFPARGLRKTRIGFQHDGRICYFTGPDGRTWSARGPGLGMYARCRRLAA